MNNRPTTDGERGSLVTTPRAAALIQSLGGVRHGPVAFSSDEFRRIKRMYGYEKDAPNVKPSPPEEPKRSDYSRPYEYEDAMRKHREALKAHADWKDPREFMQAGAERNAFRCVEADGQRLLAWISKYVAAGQDPLLVLVQMAVAAGYDVDPNDVEWATNEESQDDG